MILVLHNRYRVTGGEERAVDDLLWLVRSHLGEEAEELTRDSAVLGRRRAATALLRGGLDPGDVAAAVRRTGARIVHAHNVLPSFGWRALAAAREAGARVVLHLHNYRLVCAVAVCFTHGEDCTRCQGRNTWPGVRLGCRGTGPEAVVYAAALAAWQRRVTACADVVVVPSTFAHARLRELRAPLGARVRVVPHLVRAVAAEPRFTPGGPALVASRLAAEKGVEDAIDACRAVGLPLVVAGDGPLGTALRERARGADVTFTGRVPADVLDALRAAAGVAVVPTRAAETFGLAAAEAMAAGLPLAATRRGALADLVAAEDLAPAGDVDALGALARERRGDAGAAARGLDRIRRLCAPEVVAPLVADAYAAAVGA